MCGLLTVHVCNECLDKEPEDGASDQGFEGPGVTQAGQIAQSSTVKLPESSRLHQKSGDQQQGKQCPKGDKSEVGSGPHCL